MCVVQYVLLCNVIFAICVVAYKYWKLYVLAIVIHRVNPSSTEREPRERFVTCGGSCAIGTTVQGHLDAAGRRDA